MMARCVQARAEVATADAGVDNGSLADKLWCMRNSGTFCDVRLEAGASDVEVPLPPALSDRRDGNESHGVVASAAAASSSQLVHGAVLAASSPSLAASVVAAAAGATAPVSASEESAAVVCGTQSRTKRLSSAVVSSSSCEGVGSGGGGRDEQYGVTTLRLDGVSAAALACLVPVLYEQSVSVPPGLSAALLAGACSLSLEDAVLSRVCNAVVAALSPLDCLDVWSLLADPPTDAPGGEQMAAASPLAKLARYVEEYCTHHFEAVAHRAGATLPTPRLLRLFPRHNLRFRRSHAVSNVDGEGGSGSAVAIALTAWLDVKGDHDEGNAGTMALLTAAPLQLLSAQQLQLLAKHPRILALPACLQLLQGVVPLEQRPLGRSRRRRLPVPGKQRRLPKTPPARRCPPASSRPLPLAATAATTSNTGSLPSVDSNRYNSISNNELVVCSEQHIKDGPFPGAAERLLLEPPSPATISLPVRLSVACQTDAEPTLPDPQLLPAVLPAMGGLPPLRARLVTSSTTIAASTAATTTTSAAAATATSATAAAAATATSAATSAATTATTATLRTSADLFAASAEELAAFYVAFREVARPRLRSADDSPFSDVTESESASSPLSLSAQHDTGEADLAVSAGCGSGEDMEGGERGLHAEKEELDSSEDEVFEGFVRNLPLLSARAALLCF